MWGGLIRQWLDALLPQNALQLCRGRLKLVVTEVQYTLQSSSKQRLSVANQQSYYCLQRQGLCRGRIKLVVTEVHDALGTRQAVVCRSLLTALSVAPQREFNVCKTTRVLES